MEIGWDVRSIGVLQAWNQTSVFGVLVSPVVGEVWRTLAGVVGSALATPVGAPIAASIAMVKDVVTSTGHVVDHSIGINSDTCSSASLNHVSELFAGTTTTLKLVRSGLVVEPPWVELAILRPLVGEDGFSDGEDLDAHPALLGQVCAFFLHIIVWPAEEFNNSTFLTVFINWVLLNCASLPDEAHWFKSDSIISTAVISLDHESQGFTERAVDLVGVA